MFRSHFRHAAQSNTDSSQPRRGQVTKPPIKPVKVEEKKSSKQILHKPESAKRASRSLQPLEDAHSTVKRAEKAVNAPARHRDHSSSSTVRVGEVFVSGSPSHHLPPPSAIRIPSLVSGSTASSLDSPRSGGLRRKSPEINKYTAYKRAESSVTKTGLPAPRTTQYPTLDSFEDTVLGITLPPMGKRNSHVIPLAHRTDAPALNHNDISEISVNQGRSPVAHRYTASTTPSTRYTDSPFSHVQTPSSASSYSSVVQTNNKEPLALSHRQSPTHGLDERNHQTLGRPALPRQVTPTPPSVSSVDSYKPRHFLFGVPPQRAATEPPLLKSADAGRRPSTLDSKERSSAIQHDAHSNLKRLTQIPPELAHLNVEAPARPSLNKPLPPVRPSRDGTPVLTGMNEPSPVVQSDLSPLHTAFHRRTASQEKNDTTVSSTIKSRFGFSSRPSSRAGSAASSRSARDTASPNTLDHKPIQPHHTPYLKRQDSPAIGPAPSPVKTSRFGFFGRKSKAESQSPVEKPKRQPKRGPAAGTGHEGYGRFGFRGRSGSITSATGLRTPSSDSTSSHRGDRLVTSRQGSVGSHGDGSDLDDFLRERLTPVVLRGTGTSVVHERPGELLSREKEQKSENPSRPEDVKHTRGSTRKHEIARGRSARKSAAQEAAITHNAAMSVNSMGMEPQSSTPASAPSPSAYEMSDKGERYPGKSARGRVDSIILNDLGTRKRPVCGQATTQRSTDDRHARRRNFLQRAQASPKSKGEHDVAEMDGGPKVPVKRTPIAHYALLDHHESIGLDELENILQDSETSIEDSASEDVVLHKVVPYDKRHSSLLPSPPQPSSTSYLGAQREVNLARPPVQSGIDTTSKQDVEVMPVADLATISTPEMRQDCESPRLPRLSPVGRIPKVVSRRDHDRKLSDNSFSRPFVRAQPRPSVQPPGTLYNQIRELASPLEFNSQPFSSTAAGARSEAAFAQTQGFNCDMMAERCDEFLTLPPRQSSELSYSSSSGIGSWMAALSSLPQTEDVWNEYDELLDQVHSPDARPSHLSSASSMGAPFQYGGMLDSPGHDLVPPPLKWSQPPSMDLPLPPPRFQPVPTASSSTYRSLGPSPFPPAYISDPQVADSMSGYTRNSVYLNEIHGDAAAVVRNPSLVRSNRQSLASVRGSLSSSRYSQASSHSRSGSLPEGGPRDSRLTSTMRNRFQKNTQLLDIAEADGSKHKSRANLRFAALMTSKWLSFGQVLFSPAHNEMRLAEEPKVLVIDGLGADWSYYVALSYPMASVYNLGPSPVNGMSHWPGVSQKPPLNHRHINHNAIQASFPFPKGFFTAVVLRFPAVTRDQAYQSCIHECKRVLRPGGHLEISALDLDLMNMGSRTRRAVRDLKTRMQQRDSDVNLRNLSDTLVHLIARRGFEEVQRCIVGVPAAGRIPSSRDASSTGSGSSSLRGGGMWQPETGSGSEEEFSFADLLKDARASQIDSDREKDEGITKMVAKVGRWWYSACYERPLVHDDKSIWHDKALLRECEKQGTSYRMLICCAQKPAQPRRTVSV